jgi:3-deoxy-7-phosphoheptulonate synthase
VRPASGEVVVIILMKAEVTSSSEEVELVRRVASQHPGLRTEVRSITGAARILTEVYVLGPTAPVATSAFEALPGVEKVMRVRERFRTIGRHEGRAEAAGFEYNGLRFTEDSFHVFAGLCAVDNRENVERTFRALSENGVTTTRAGAYKPRTSPYEFQGRGKECLPYLFELAGRYGIRVIAMEVLRDSHIDEIREALEQAGRPTGVMLQIGTRNAQNFELLKSVGQQQEFPVLFKRGMGITLEESLNAVEYVAASGNHRIVFCLRGVKTHLGDPHRNFVDFAHVPVLKRLARLPVCVDPSHSVGTKTAGPDGLPDIHHVTAQGIIAGANMVLVDIHPSPTEAMCDGPQALTLDELPHFLEDCALVRAAYKDRLALLARHRAKEL